MYVFLEFSINLDRSGVFKVVRPLESCGSPKDFFFFATTCYFVGFTLSRQDNKKTNKTNKQDSRSVVLVVVVVVVVWLLFQIFCIYIYILLLSPKNTAVPKKSVALYRVGSTPQQK